MAYYCRLYAVDEGMRLPTRDKDTNALLGAVLKQLEVVRAPAQPRPHPRPHHVSPTPTLSFARPRLGGDEEEFRPVYDAWYNPRAASNPADQPTAHMLCPVATVALAKPKSRPLACLLRVVLHSC